MTEISLVEDINFKWYVVGVVNRRITGLVPRGVISLLRIVGVVCLENLSPGSDSVAPLPHRGYECVVKKKPPD